MDDLEHNLLKAWREDTTDVRAKIGKLADVLSEHLSFEKAEHDDLMDLATHVKLSSALAAPPRATPRAIPRATPRTVVAPKPKRREPVPETPPLARDAQRRRHPRQPKKHPAHFFNPDSVLETAYVVGSEINYYGCDTMSCVNV